MIKTRVPEVRSIENKEILMAITMTIIIITTIIIMKLVIIKMMIMKIKIGNGIRI